jgi:hypothetical protein
MGIIKRKIRLLPPLVKIYSDMTITYANRMMQARFSRGNLLDA